MEKQAQFVALLNSNRNLVYKVITRFAGDDLREEDLFQEIALEAWRSFDSYEGKSAFSTWLHQVAFNTCTSVLRKAKAAFRQVVLMDNIFFEIADDGPYEERYIPVVENLCEDDKKILDMTIEGICQKAIAQAVGRTPNDVRVRVHRIKNRLKKALHESEC